MSKFIFRLVVFLLPIMLMLGVVEMRLSRIPTGDRLRRTYLEQKIDNVEIVVTGSSHAYYAIQPKMLGVPAFSIASPSQDIYYDSRILLQYLSRARKLRLVIIPISYFTFNGTLEESSESWRTAYYKRFWGIARPSGQPRIEDYSYVALFGFSQTRSFFLNGFPSAALQQFDDSGGTTQMRQSDPSSIMDARETVARHSASFTTYHVVKNVHYLEELLQELQNRGIRVVLITTPCFHSYYDIMTPSIYQVMQSEIRTLCGKFGLEYRNYLTDSRFTIDDFSDSDHLSTLGGAKFTRILKDDVVNRYIPN